VSHSLDGLAVVSEPLGGPTMQGRNLIGQPSAELQTQSVLHSGVHSVTVALTKGFDTALLVGAGFAITGAIRTAIMISSRDSREYSEAARGGGGGAGGGALERSWDRACSAAGCGTVRVSGQGAVELRA
jgi:hypothetical protein